MLYNYKEIVNYLPAGVLISVS